MFSEYVTKQDKEIESFIILCKRVLNVRKYSNTKKSQCRARETTDFT